MKLNKSDINEVISKVITRLINESYEANEEEELTPFERYQYNYPHESFDAEPTKGNLIDWCKNYGDFLYIYKNIRGKYKIMNANTEHIKKAIYEDILNCLSVHRTHEMDYLLDEKQINFDKNFVSVLKLEFHNSEDNYYIIYQKEID